jgi:hypothetical protein
MTKAKASCVCMALLAMSAAHAQAETFGFELTPFGGYTFGGDFDDMATSASLALEDRANFGLILNIRESPNTQWEILYSRQATEADTAGLPVSGPPLDLDVHYIHGGGTYLFDGSHAHPFLAATIGASHFVPGPDTVGSETFFSFSLGVGLQIRPNDRFGVRLEARGFGSLMNSDTDLFCQSGPAGGLCAIHVEGTMFWQFQTTAGFVFRF